MDDASKPTHFRQRIDRYTVRSWTESPQTITKHTDSMSQPSRQTERRAEDGPIIGGPPPFKSPVPPDLQGSFSKTATSRDGLRKVTAFQFPGAVVLSYLDLGQSRDQSRRVRRRIIGPEPEYFVPETQLDTQPESVPSSIPSSTFTSVQTGVEDGWRGRGLMPLMMDFSTEMRENWTEGHPKSTVTWMDTQTAEAAETARDDDQLPDLIQIAGN